MSSVVLSVNDKLQKQLIELTGDDDALRDRLIARFNTVLFDHLESFDNLPQLEDLENINRGNEIQKTCSKWSAHKAVKVIKTVLTPFSYVHASYA